jgi:hypothetical protein
MKGKGSTAEKDGFSTAHGFEKRSPVSPFTFLDRKLSSPDSAPRTDICSKHHVNRNKESG